MQAAGAPHAQPRHAFESSAAVPAVVFVGNPAGQSLAPSFVTQLWKRLEGDGVHVRPAPQEPLEGVSWQRRPSDTLSVRVAFAAQDAGPAWETFANAPAGIVTDAESGLHTATSEATLAVVAPTVHVASPVTVSVKLPLEHEPPTPVHVHAHVGVPSPLTWRTSVVIVPSGHVDRDEVAKRAGVHPAGTVPQLHEVAPPSPPPPSSAPPSPVAASGVPNVRSGNELHATVSAAHTSTK